MTGSSRKPSNVSGPISKGKKRAPAVANPKPLSSSSTVQVMNVTKKDKHVMGLPDKKEESIQRIDEIKSTEVSGHREEKGNNECQITNEELKQLTEAAECISKFLEKVPKSEIKNKDVEDLIENLHCDLTSYLKDEQGSQISGTSQGSSSHGNKIGEGQNYTILCGGADKVLGTLDDLVQIYKFKLCVQENDSRYPLKEIVQNAPPLIDENGRPSRQLLKLFREILSKVLHLNDHGKTHIHLNPRSILICEEGSEENRKKNLFLRAKLSPDSPGLSSSSTSSDILEWQAPEQRKDPRVQKFSANVYSLGAIFYYCFTGERPSNRWKTVGNSSLMVGFPEADDLISRSLMEKPESRPTAIELLSHPLFWSSEKRLSFIRDTSERASYRLCRDLWDELNKISVLTVIGRECKENQFQTWYARINDESIRNYIKKKKEECGYDFRSVRALVRLIRNMMVHYGELPEDVQHSVGTLHKGFDNYFTSRFPNLLIEVHKAARKPSKEYKYFGRFFKFKRRWLFSFCQ